MARTLQRIEYDMTYYSEDFDSQFTEFFSADFDGHCRPHNLRRGSVQVRETTPRLVQRSISRPVRYVGLCNIYDGYIPPKCANYLPVCLMLPPVIYLR